MLVGGVFRGRSEMSGCGEVVGVGEDGAVFVAYSGVWEIRDMAAGGDERAVCGPEQCSEFRGSIGGSDFAKATYVVGGI